MGTASSSETSVVISPGTLSYHKRFESLTYYLSRDCECLLLRRNEVIVHMPSEVDGISL